MKYDRFTPEVSSIHAMLTVNGKVGAARNRVTFYTRRTDQIDHDLDHLDHHGTLRDVVQDLCA